MYDCIGKNFFSANSFTKNEMKASGQGLFSSNGFSESFKDTSFSSVSVFPKNAIVVGDMSREKATVDWSKANIGISKETMDVVETECVMNPEYVKKYSELR